MSRKRSPHPGIVVLPARPEKRQAASIRYRDPDSGKARVERIPDGAGLEWLKRRSLELANRRQALLDGAPRVVGNSIESLIADFFKESTIGDSTAKQYRISANQMVSWAPGAQIRSGDDLTLAKLRELRAWLVKLPGRRPVTTNRDLKQLKAILEHSRLAGRCARLSREAIADGLQLVKAPVERRPFLLEPGRALADCEGDLELQTFVAFLLLTGCRAGEALGLRCSAVDLPRASVHLEADETKTARWRDIDLGWTPFGYMLCELLAAGAPPERSLVQLTKWTSRRMRRSVAQGWDFQMLRRTTSTFLCSMPNVGLWRAAKSLGHHPDVARRYYAGVVRTEETELERAMGIRPQLKKLLLAVRESRSELPSGLLVSGLR